MFWLALFSRTPLLLSRGTCKLDPSSHRLSCGGDLAQGGTVPGEEFD